MKIKKNTLLPLISLSVLLPQTVSASMTFVDMPTTSYTAGTTVTAIADDTTFVGSFYGDAMGSYENISMAFSSTMDGNLDIHPTLLRFYTGSDLAMGESVCITVTANMQLASHRQADNLSWRRGAVLARVNANNATSTTLNGSTSMTITGGVDTLAGYAGGSTPTIAAGDTSYQSGNDFYYNSTEGSLGGAAGTSQFQSFTGTDTMNFLTGDDINGQNGSSLPNQYSVAIMDSDRSSTNFSWQSFTFCYTNTSADALVSGTEIRFTVDGMNPLEQQALIPEPSSLALIALGGLSIMRRRR